MTKTGEKTSRTQVQLNEEEKAHGGTIRRCAYYILCLLGLIALVMTYFASIAWYDTIDLTSGFVRSGSLGFFTTHGMGLYEKLLTLDISSISAFIVLAFSFSLLFGTGKIVVAHWRNGTERFCYAYRVRLFPSGLGPLSIRLGLIGTLVSFVLIALMLFQSSTQDTMAHFASQANGSAVARETASLSVIDDVNESSERASSGQIHEVPVTEVQEADPFSSLERADQTSFQVFLLLCASLYSTLVGCLFGYFIIPFLEGIAAWATGRKQMDVMDAMAVQEKYLSQIKEITQTFENTKRLFEQIERYADAADPVLVQLERLSNAIEKSTQGAADIKTAGDSLKETADSLHMAREDIEAAAEQMTKATQMAAKLESHSTSWLKALRKTGKVSRATIRSIRQTGERVASRVETAANGVSSQLRSDLSEVHSALKKDQEASLDKAKILKECSSQIASEARQMTKLVTELREANCGKAADGNGGGVFKGGLMRACQLLSRKAIPTPLPVAHEIKTIKSGGIGSDHDSNSRPLGDDACEGRNVQ
jgi:uncharacterized coiled-coil DUF342 family protein